MNKDLGEYLNFDELDGEYENIDEVERKIMFWRGNEISMGTYSSEIQIIDHNERIDTGEWTCGCGNYKDNKVSTKLCARCKRKIKHTKWDYVQIYPTRIVLSKKQEEVKTIGSIALL